MAKINGIEHERYDDSKLTPEQRSPDAATFAAMRQTDDRWVIERLAS